MGWLMYRAVVKNHPCGDVSIALNLLLQDEPLALYIDPQSQAMALKLSGGGIVQLNYDNGSPRLSLQDEVTIESFVGGILAAGYRVGVRKLAN